MSAKVIRALQPQDLDGLLRLYAQLIVDDEALPPREQVEAVWREVLARPGMRLFGGWAGDQLVSTCVITVMPNLTRGCRPYALIENVVTDAGHRCQGWGQALLAAALEHAWAQRCYKVMLLTGRRDEATLRFYEQAGFERHSKTAFLCKPLA